MILTFCPVTPVPLQLITPKQFWNVVHCAIICELFVVLSLLTELKSGILIDVIVATMCIYSDE